MGSSQELEDGKARWLSPADRENAGRLSSEVSELVPVRSQNGTGCADLPDEEKSRDVDVDDDEDPFEVSFDGDDDPLNPRSMHIFRKWLLVCIVGMGSLCVTSTSSIYTATYGQMNPEFHQSDLVGTVGLSTFVLGLASGPLFMGPLSEFYGRRPVYLVAFTMFVIWIIPSAVAHNTATMLSVRYIDGFAGSAFLSVTGGTISDIFRRDQIQSPMIIISLSPFIGPSVGPLLGGFINFFTNWRWTYYVLIIWAGTILLMLVLFAPETYHPIILRRKARAMRKETGDDRWKAPMEKTSKSILQTVGLSLLRPFQLLAFEPMCLLLSLLSAVLLGIIYLFFGAFPLVFGDNYGFNLWQIGLSFLGIMVGMIAGALSHPIWRRIYGQMMLKNNGIPEPEFRLASTILGAVLVPIGLFWFAWTSFPHIHWIVPILGSVVFGLGTLLVFNGIFTFLVDTYPLYAASALGANSFLRCVFATAFPLFGTQMYNKLGYQWASSLLAFLTVSLMPLPYVFFHYGKRLRKRSRFTTHKG
ncbi:major facilitator superfamily domain-containing protein [Xylaria sp. CBS 124048]|nr:major facilitator superfamily domain-containing protein [Xylaria sp. CBS 124048]